MRTTPLMSALGFLCGFVLTPSALCATPDAAPTATFPFVIPWDDAQPSPLDVSGLNDGPAGSHGFIVVKDGHFAESSTGRRVRFLGTNFGLNGCFPAHADAEKVAAHLAKYGTNLVRLTLQDVTWAGGDNTLWDETHYKDHRHMDPAQLDKMDYLVAQLEKSGIYIDMGLHSGRTFIPEDGFPQGVKRLQSNDKRVDEFDPAMIAVNKEYARQLLLHINPYTKRAYARDPGLLDVEINNENSLVAYESSGPVGGGLAGLPQPYLGELQGLWNGWLKKRYGATARLAAAWKSPDATHGPNLYPWSPDPATWTLEAHPPAAATLVRDGDALRADISAADDTDWHVQLYHAGLSLIESGRTYTLRFEAKADRTRGLPVSTILDHPGYISLGLAGAAPLSPQWQTFSFTFQAAGAESGHNRIPSFTLGTQTGTVWVRNIVLKEGTGGWALPAAQTLEGGMVSCEPSGQGKARGDWVQFLADTETAYANGMRTFLRRDLGVRPLVRVSQVGFGGLYGEYREQASDFADNHAYWDYHDNLTEPIADRPMAPRLGAGDPMTGQVFLRLAWEPFTLSEVNQCFPNEYRAEMLPDYAAFAAVQDWDALILYTQQDYGADGVKYGSLDRIAGTFDADKDPAVAGFMPAAALMFRAGLVPCAPGEESLTLPAAYPALRVARGEGLADLCRAQGAKPADGFGRRVAVRLGGAVAGVTGTPARTLRVQTQDPAAARFVADAPGAKAVTGFVGGQTVTFTGASVTFGALPNGFGALTLTALDRRPLAHSARALLTFVTRTQNTGQVWNAARTLLTTPGSGPILVDGAAASVSLQTDGPRRVYALDVTGQRGAEVPSKYHDGRLAFSVGPAQKTIWYAITAL